MIINKLKISLALVISLVLVLAVFGAWSVQSVLAAAGDVTWEGAETVDLSSPDMNLTIALGSTAESIIYNTGTVVPTLASGDVFTISTAAAGTIAVSPTTGVVITCNSSTIDTAVITATGSQAYTITPTTTACSYLAPSGGGGGVYVDTTPPTNTSISINNGDLSVTSTTVTLTLGATGASNVMLSNDSSFTSGAWVSYTTPKTWTLSGSDGLKTVYAKFKDSSGNVSTAISDTITLGATTTTGGLTTTTTTTTDTTGTTSTTTLGAYSGLLKKGSSGTNVSKMQEVLLDLGYNLGSWGADGSFGGMTVTAIKAYQTSKSLTADGIVGPATWASLQTSSGTTTPATTTTDTTASTSGYVFSGSTPLKVGSKGTEVTELQTLLNGVSLGCGTADGVFGTKTSSCVKAFQILKNLTADGIVGSATRAELNKL